MSCFPCINSPRKDVRRARRSKSIGDSTFRSDARFMPVDSLARESSVAVNGEKNSRAVAVNGEKNSRAVSLSFKELAVATQNFKECNLLGEGGFGKVFKGRLETGQVVAIKQLNHNGVQGSKEFLVEILMLIMLQHHNLVSLTGFCMEGDERLLVYEYMPKGSLEKHLFDLPADAVPLNWNTRIKIAVGAAKGLEYLHDVANPPVIYRDLKSANILLDDDFNPKLSDFGLAKLGPVGDNTHVSTRVMGTYGYCAPDYAMSGKLTIKSDIYSFGVLLLELITGRKAYDSTKPTGEQNLIAWARPYLSDRRKINRLADPLLQDQYPLRPFYQLTVITSMCLQEQPTYRPIIRDVVIALEHIASQPYNPEIHGLVPNSPTLSSPSPHANVRSRLRARG